MKETSCKRGLICCHVFALVVGLSGAARAQDVVMAREAGAAMLIVRPVDATATEHFAIEELVTHLERITGRAFESVLESELPEGTPAIFVGHTRFASATGIKASALGGEEWLMRTVGGSLVLTGGRPRGTLYAVYQFLEDELGVAWLSEEITLLPERPNLVIGQLNRTGKPAFTDSRWVYNSLRAMNHFPEAIEKTQLWMSRNKGVGEWMFSEPRYGVPLRGTYATCHNFYALIPPDTYFDEHPEWFSMGVNGERQRVSGQLCLTNEEMTAEVIRRFLEFIPEDRDRAAAAGQPYPTLYELSQNDHHRFLCLCPECKAVVEQEGTHSGLLLHFVNQVAEAVGARYPDVSFQTFAYSQTAEPPAKIRPRSNVIMQNALLMTGKWRDPSKPLSHPYHGSHRRILEGWQEAGAQIGIWDYWSLFGSQPFPTPFANVANLQGDLAYLRSLGATRGYFTQLDHRPYTLSFYQLTRWLGQKLLDDPDQNAEASITRFMENYYGAGAPAMGEWLDYLQRRLADETGGIPSPVSAFQRRYLDLELFRRADELLSKAEGACAPDAPEYPRVLNERLPVDAALLGLWDTLVNRLPEGQAMPWTHADVIARYAANKRAVLPMFHYPQTLPGALADLEKEVAALRTELERPPLPEAFRNLPKEDVVDILALRHHRIIEDAEAPGGRAFRLPFGSQDPVPVGLYTPPRTFADDNPRAQKFGPALLFQLPTAEQQEEWYEQGMAGNRPANATSIPGDEIYHWYRLGPWRIEPGTLIHVHRSWQLQVGLDRALSVGHLEQDWFVFVSLKFEGPSYVQGSKKEDSIFIGRVLLLRAESHGASEFHP